MGRRVLILCTGNSCRSQMAQAVLQRLGGTEYEVFSAGTNPASAVHPMAVRILTERGFDMAEARPKHVSEFAGQRFHRVITVCDSANESCPYFPGAERIHWPFDDPAAATGSEEDRWKVFQRVYREIRARMEFWIEIDRRRPDLTPEAAAPAL